MALNNDATLASINFPDDPGIALDPDFHSDTLNYEAVLPNGTMDAPVIAATATDPSASLIVEAALDVNSEDIADRQSYILVTASDGETSRLYTVTFNVEPSGFEDPQRGQVFIYPNPAQNSVQLASVQILKS